MIFHRPPPEDAIDQGDILDGCPVLAVLDFDPATGEPLQTKRTPSRVIVLTQTCDLANRKVNRVLVAVVMAARLLVDQGALRAVDVRGPIRQGRVWGWYFLPKNDEGGLPESIVDFRQLHTVRMDLLASLCQRGLRRARVPPLYREHLAKHFAGTYSRIGLPEPYATD
jgi:hypothetical protein